MVLIPPLHPALWIFLSYLKKCSFIFQEYIRAVQFSHRQKHYTYLQMSYIMMWILCTEMFWWGIETMQPFPVSSAPSDPGKRSSLCCLCFSNVRKDGAQNSWHCSRQATQLLSEENVDSQFTCFFSYFGHCF